MEISGNLTPRIVWGIIVEVLVFIVTIVLAMINSSEWPGEFFWLTMGTIVVLNSECRSDAAVVSASDD